MGITIDWRRVGSWSVRAASVFLVCGATLTPDADAGKNVPFSWCLTCPPTWLADVVSNVLLFVPLGFAFAFRTSNRAPTPWWRSFAFAVLLSFVIETLQFLGLPDTRTASFTDWGANALGGLIGALMCAYRERLWYPAPSAARVNATLMASATLAVFGATAWAVAPDVPPKSLTGAQSAQRDTSTKVSDIRASSLPHVPGFGWFGGVTERHNVNGTEMVHHGTGPIILQMSPSDSVRVQSVERGRDEATVIVPIVFVHSYSSIEPTIFIAQHDRDVILQARLNATRIGLVPPRARIRNVLPANRRDSVSHSELDATIASGHWRLSGRMQSGDSVSASVPLTAAIGWTLIQSIVGLDSRAAWLAHPLWLLAWFGAIGWYCGATSSTPGRGVMLALESSAIVLVLADLIAWRASVSLLGIVDLLVAVAGAAVGAMMWQAVRRQPPRQDTIVE